MANTASQAPRKITTSLPHLASFIDHSLLHPTLTDAQILSGLHTALHHRVAAVCVKPYSVPLARQLLAGSPVHVCTVVGFPHGNSTTAIKVAEAREAVEHGASEIDMVVNIGKVKSQDWGYVEQEIRAVNDTVTSLTIDSHGSQALVKVIFENDHLAPSEITELCAICNSVGVAFVKTSTGYGFVKQENGMYAYKGATVEDLRLMRERCGPQVQIKAAGGVRTLDELLEVIALGVTRVGASATVEILEEARRRGIGEEMAEFEF